MTNNGKSKRISKLLKKDIDAFGPAEEKSLTIMITIKITRISGMKETSSENIMTETYEDDSDDRNKNNRNVNQVKDIIEIESDEEQCKKEEDRYDENIEYNDNDSNYHTTQNRKQQCQ